VYYLEELANWIDTQEFNFVYWNMMHDAPYFSIANLSKTVKQAVTDKISLANVSTKNKQEFIKIIDFMNNSKQDMSEQMLQKIYELDTRRNESLSIIEPEFAKLIRYNNE
jgi:hypothetical protein